MLRIAWLSVPLVCSLACAAPIDPITAHLQEGEAALAEGRPAAALEAYRAAVALAPENRPALVGVLRAETLRGDGEGALRALRALDAHAPGTSELVDVCATLTLAARERLTRGELDAALGTGREMAVRGCPASDSQPLVAEAHIARGAREHGAGRVESAIEAYVAAVEADPRRADIFALAAEFLLGEGRAREAVQLVAVALDHHPENRVLRNLMVRALSAR